MTLCMWHFQLILGHFSHHWSNLFLFSLWHSHHWSAISELESAVCHAVDHFTIQIGNFTQRGSSPHKIFNNGLNDIPTRKKSCKELPGFVQSWKVLDVKSPDRSYPIACQFIHVLDILHRSCNWTKVWIRIKVCLWLEELFADTYKVTMLHGVRKWLEVPVSPKIELSGNLANNWKQWKQVWSTYELVFLGKVHIFCSF